MYFQFLSHSRKRILFSIEGKRRKMLLPRWESNNTSPTCRAGALTARLQSDLAFFAYQSIIVPPQYSCPPSDTARAVVLRCEGDRCWCRPCHSYVRCSNPGGAAVTEECCVHACLRACVLSEVTNEGKRRKMLLPRWESNHTSPACRAGALTTRLQSALSFFAY